MRWGLWLVILGLLRLWFGLGADAWGHLSCVRSVEIDHIVVMWYLYTVRSSCMEVDWEDIRTANACVFVRSFVAGLRNHLQSVYPPASVSSNTSSSGSVSLYMTHVHYRRHNYVVEYTPLMLAYVVLCLYLYFSVREFTHMLAQSAIVIHGDYCLDHLAINSIPTAYGFWSCNMPEFFCWFLEIYK